MSTNSVIELTSDKDFTTLVLEADPKKLVVVDFYAVWCRPCKAFAPRFEQIANEYQDVMLYKLDVEGKDCPEIGATVQQMPTFRFYKNGKMIREVAGADEKIIKTTLDNNK